MATKQQMLDSIKQQFLQAGVTSQLEQQATNIVFGEGDPDARVVFVGEAPGKNEDLQGRPFIGASGKFLDELLASIGMNREVVYITSIVKYRPPNNRDPLPAEKSNSFPYLQAQLEVIQPDVLVTLGRHSLNCFLPDLQISSAHGVPQRIRLMPSHLMKGLTETIREIILLPLFHPAAALYNRGIRPILLDDFAKISDALAAGNYSLGIRQSK